MKRMIQKGFTLIELMIVVAIIGILAAVALPAYQDYTIRAQLSESMALSGGLKTAVGDYFAASGAFPADNEKAICGDNPDNAGCAGSTPESNKGNYVEAITVDDGTLLVNIGNKANTAIASATLSLRPLLDGASNISWQCGRGALPAGLPTTQPSAAIVLDDQPSAKYLPNSCK
jgi:type IV pilus assembly protein PilA